MTSSMPRDPDEQLRVGISVIEAAFQEKARAFDHERNQLRAYGKEQAQQVSVLERRVAELEQQVRDGDERARQMNEEKMHMQQEMKAMQRELSKLDSFKRSIMQSIKDDEVPGYSYGGSTDFTPSYTPRESLTTGQPAGPASPAAACSFSALQSAPGSAFPRGISPAPPQTASAAPTQSGSPTSGAPGSTAQVKLDGKDFFRQARLRLTYEQFNQFLTNIKRLNDHAQSRDETIQRAQEIFGNDNADLFLSFKSLLSKHGLS